MPAIVRPTVVKLSERGPRDGSSPVESFGPGAATTQRIFRCEWANRFKAARAILGYSDLEYNGSGKIIGLRRLTPLPHPDIQAGITDGPGNMYAVKINSITPVKATGSSVSTYDSNAKTGGNAKRTSFYYADINVQYENPGYTVATETEIGEQAFQASGITGTLTTTTEIHITSTAPTSAWVGRAFTIIAGTATAGTYTVLTVDTGTNKITLNNPAGTVGQTVTDGTVEEVPGAYSVREIERFVRILEPTPSFDYVQLPGGTFNFIKNGGGGPTGVIPNTNFGRIFGTTQHKLLWKRLPFFLYNLSTPSDWQKRIWGDNDYPDRLPLIGTINKYYWAGFRPGTLLLENVRPIPVDSMFGYVYEWDIEFTLNHDPHGWNWKYYYPQSSNTTDRGWYYVGAGSTYYAPGSVPDDKSIYNERDFDLLFDVRDNDIIPYP